MGVNLTWVCHEHKMQHTSMRGEESIDFQALVRKHTECFKNGNMRAYHDGWFHNESYAEFFPDWEKRPSMIGY